MSENFQIQKWDTEFFGFPVAKIPKDLNDISIFESLFKENIGLVYYKSFYKPLPDKFLDNNYYDITFTGKRIPIEKKMVNNIPFHDKISIFKEPHPTSELIELAYLAGRQSRYGVDEKIPEKQYQNLLKIWIVNSIKKIMADDVLVYKHENKIVGFATLRIKNNIGNSPLFAVAREFEGKGVSFALMRAIETYLVQHNCDYLVSATHSENAKALSVYKRYGAKPMAPEFDYHFWKKH